MAAAGSLPRFATDTARSSVAVVDDDADFVRYLETFLTLRGYDARSYTRGGEILAAIRHGDPDTVLLDVATPGMDGLQTPKALKSARPGLPVIMLSGREQADIIVEAMHLGGEDALAAERVAIVDTLRQVQWNRRKAAQRLRVSYKTLLNKIKETGIDPADEKPVSVARRLEEAPTRD